MKPKSKEMLAQFGPIFDGAILRGFSMPPVGPRVAVLGPECGELQCTGEDACEFINRMTTLSPHKMSDGGYQQGFLLEHNGKIKVSFDLYRHNQQSLRLFCAPNELALLADTLEMFHFAEDIEFTQHAPRQMLVLMTSEAVNLAGSREPEDTVLEQWRSQSELHTRVCNLDELVSHILTIFDGGCTVEGFDDFQRLRIGLGIGSWLHEYTSSVTPLDVNGLAGIVQHKGCYPGQEVIERTLALGRPAKKLARIIGTQLLEGHEVLDDSEKKVGVITSVVKFDESSMCGLAIVKGKIDFSQIFHTSQGTVSLCAVGD